jgi:hypothetical protein
MEPHPGPAFLDVWQGKDLQEGNFGSVADKDGEVNSPLQGERWAGAEAQATS